MKIYVTLMDFKQVTHIYRDRESRTNDEARERGRERARKIGMDPSELSILITNEEEGETL